MDLGMVYSVGGFLYSRCHLLLLLALLLTVIACFYFLAFWRLGTRLFAAGGDVMAVMRITWISHYGSRAVLATVRRPEKIAAWLTDWCFRPACLKPAWSLTACLNFQSGGLMLPQQVAKAQRARYI
jgi:hypothetical protein